jgi:cytoskeletal protein CcmA (bactofilin family)
MSDPEGQSSGLPVEKSPLNPSSSAADFLPDTSQYFEAWLENLKPSLESTKNQSQPETVAAAPTADALTSGEFRFEGTLRVDGYAAGFLRSLTGTLIVGQSGEAECDMIVATVIIDGCVRGNIHATERVELGSHARVFGKIESPVLSIAPGALFEGECHFLPSPFKADSEDDGRTSSSNHTVSSPNRSGPSDEAAEPMTVAASR